MKDDLSTFPDMNDKKYDVGTHWTNEVLKDKYYSVITDMDKWKKDFAKELREKCEPCGFLKMKTFCVLCPKKLSPREILGITS